MRVHRATADGGASAPDLAEQLHSRCDRSPPSHQGEEEPEFRSGHPYRLSSAQNRLSSGLQEHAAEANRSRQSRSSTGRKTASSSEQLLHSRDQLADDRRVCVTGAIQLIWTNEVSLCAWERKRSRNLKFMYDRACLFVYIERFDWTELSRDSGHVRFIFFIFLIVDDEDSRNASIVGAAADRPGSCGEGYVGADTGWGRVTRGLR